MATQTQELVDEILRLKKERNAVILAHNYQRGEIQEIADYIGDSLLLSQRAAQVEAKIIVFCGVHFMAETAAIIARDKLVLIPDLNAGCSLASMISAQALRCWKEQFTDAVVVCYINCTAEVKAESDYCCTSTNAVKVINAIPPDKEILFVPDQFLGLYLQKITGRKIHIWPGYCHAHHKIKYEDIMNLKSKYPDAEFIMHPECGCLTHCMPHADKILSTEGIVRYCRESQSKEFIVGTEVGILHRLRKESPNKSFYPATEESYCEFMKLNTLEKVLWSLEDLKYKVIVPDEIASKAKQAIDRMLAIV